MRVTACMPCLTPGWTKRGVAKGRLQRTLFIVSLSLHAWHPTTSKRERTLRGDCSRLENKMYGCALSVGLLRRRRFFILILHSVGCAVITFILEFFFRCRLASTAQCSSFSAVVQFPSSAAVRHAVLPFTALRLLRRPGSGASWSLIKRDMLPTLPSLMSMRARASRSLSRRLRRQPRLFTTIVPFAMLRLTRLPPCLLRDGHSSRDLLSW